MNRPEYKPPKIQRPSDDPDEPDWNLIKDVVQHGVAEPFTAGVFFAISWLGTFYILKKQFNI